MNIIKDVHPDTAARWFSVLERACNACEATMLTIKRKRSWTPAQKAMALVPYHTRLHVFREMQQMLSETFNIPHSSSPKDFKP